MPLSELLEILVCPETGRPLQVAEAALLERVNGAIADGRARTRGGEVPSGPIAAGLVREGSDLLYPIRDGIPIMLDHEAIPLEALS